MGGGGGGMTEVTEGDGFVADSLLFVSLVLLVVSMFCCIASLYRYCILHPTPESSISAEATMSLYFTAVYLEKGVLSLLSTALAYLSA